MDACEDELNGLIFNVLYCIIYTFPHRFYINSDFRIYSREADSYSELRIDVCQTYLSDG